MDVYIGMDISLQTTHACVVDSEGKTMQEGIAESDVAALAAWLRSHGVGWNIKRIVFETGQLSAHLYHGLKAVGFPVVCIDARHANGTLKAQRVKTDKNDARGLAQLARTGWYKAVHVKSDEGQSLRTLVGGRKQLVNTRLTIEDHIRGTLKIFGIKLGTLAEANGKFSAKVKAAIAGQDALVKETMLALLKAHDGVAAQEQALGRRCTAIARKDTVCKRLMTMPGVGPIVALAFKAEIDDPARFRKSRDVGVHLGLTPRKYASGEIEFDGRISKCGNGAMRSLLFGAAVVMLARSKKWSSLRSWGVRLAQRNGFKVASTALARKIAVVMHRMWVDETDFAYGNAPAEQAA